MAQTKNKRITFKRNRNPKKETVYRRYRTCVCSTQTQQWILKGLEKIELEFGLMALDHNLRKKIAT